MRQGQPHCAEFQESRRAGIKDVAGNIDVGHGIAIKQKFIVTEVKDQRGAGDKNRDCN